MIRRRPLVALLFAPLALTACQAPSAMTTVTPTMTQTVTSAAAAGATPSTASATSSSAAPQGSGTPTRSASAAPSASAEPLVKECLDGTGVCYQHASSVTRVPMSGGDKAGAQVADRLVRKDVEIVRVLVSPLSGASGCTAWGDGQVGTSRVVATTPVELGELQVSEQQHTGAQAYVVQAVQANPGHGFRPVVALTQHVKAAVPGPVDFCDTSAFTMGVALSSGHRLQMYSSPGLKEGHFATMEEALEALSSRPYQAAVEIISTVARQG